MEELKKAQEKIELLEENLKAKDDIIASKDEELNALKAKVTETEEAKKAVETERDNIKAEIARRDEEIKQSTIKARKEELGEEYIKANSVKDEDLLDNVKFENAKLKKENAELKKNPENAMIAGSRQPKSKDEIQKAHDKVEAEAYGYEGSEEK
jgi:chromosome segregation ATPase